MGQVVRQAPSSINKDEVVGVQTVAGKPIPANSQRVSFSLQNIGTTKVFVRFGAAPVISGATKYFSFILPPDSGESEGQGGTLTVDYFQGDVWVSTESGTSEVIATEFIR